MSRIASLAAAAALLGFSAAAASAAEPITVLSQGENFAVSYAPGYEGNVLGGGAVRVEGQGESQRIAYADGSLARRVPGLAVQVGGGNGDIVYLPLAASATLAAR
jgi:hypothetical protein